MPALFMRTWRRHCRLSQAAANDLTYLPFSEFCWLERFLMLRFAASLLLSIRAVDDGDCCTRSFAAIDEEGRSCSAVTAPVSRSLPCGNVSPLSGWLAIIYALPVKGTAFLWSTFLLSLLFCVLALESNCCNLGRLVLRCCCFVAMLEVCTVVFCWSRLLANYRLWWCSSLYSRPGPLDAHLTCCCLQISDGGDALCELHSMFKQSSPLLISLTIGLAAIINKQRVLLVAMLDSLSLNNELHNDSS